MRLQKQFTWLYAIVLYVLTETGLHSLVGSTVHRAIHTQHGATLEDNIWILDVALRAIIIPLLVGAICAVFLKPKEFLDFWPILVAPFISGATRLLLIDLSPPTLLSFYQWLQWAGAAAIAALLSYAGARLCNLLTKTVEN